MNANGFAALAETGILPRSSSQLCLSVSRYYFRKNEKKKYRKKLFHFLKPNEEMMIPVLENENNYEANTLPNLNTMTLGFCTYLCVIASPPLDLHSSVGSHMNTRVTVECLRQCL